MPLESFVWRPGAGPDRDAVARLRRNFVRPRYAMGEAWFMSKERYFFEYLNGDLSLLSAEDLIKPLEEIARGTCAFGHANEWSSWYHHLLAMLVTRSHEAWVEPLLEHLVTGFMTQYPNGIEREPYAGFRHDALHTLGQCIMDKECWNGDDIIVGKVLHRSNNNPNRVWGWYGASGDFSASIFFCLKYLPGESIEPWLESVLRIRSPHWRAQLVVWLTGALSVLGGKIGWPSEFKIGDQPSICWATSHCIGPAQREMQAKPSSRLIPETNRVIAQRVIRSALTLDRCAEWLSSVSSVDYLKDELFEIPDEFLRLYLR